MVPCDEEGVRPVKVIVVDTRTHEIDSIPVPFNEVYSYQSHGYLDIHPDRQRELDAETERALSRNLEGASRAMRVYLDRRMHQFYQVQESKRDLATSIKEACPECRNKVPFVESSPEGDSFLQKHPEYPSQFHDKEGQATLCRALALRKYEWKTKHNKLSDPTPDYWCMNPKCRCRLKGYDSRKGAGDAFQCSNPFCNRDNTKKYTSRSIKGE